ncbi:ThuA domain-containing protein [Sphingosinicella sp. CPCC 101087]|uniref:ThuA domain-containing protein n=1 Tax=Sphingosinicella sp. CPCC 101087 TaxID=2497754 RepID=UPI00101CAE90|nr:ThuA domain-containing protein [Sphingosinicella sp. CPCC 101087]
MIRALLSLLLLLAGGTALSADPGPGLEGKRVLIFSHSTGFRHESIDAAVPSLRAAISAAGGVPIASEDPDIFSSERLARLDAIILVSTTTDRRRPESEWLSGGRRDAFQAFVRRGGGVVGIHAASDSHYHWLWYGEMLGGRFRRHPPGTAQGRLRVVDPAHPATKRLDPQFGHHDEWYVIDDRDASTSLLLTLDPASIGEPAGPDWPISWAREHEGGRIFYTALGHTTEAWSQPAMINHVLGGLEWVLDR